MKDITNRADIDQLMIAFYGKAMTDPVIGFIFTDVAKLDLEAHVPQITSFWETVLLGARSYDGSPFAKHVPVHAKVELREGHFKRWLGLWFGTVDELFAGEHANQAKVHALRVGQAFHQRLQSFPSPRDAATEGIVVETYTPRS